MHMRVPFVILLALVVMPAALAARPRRFNPTSRALKAAAGAGTSWQLSEAQVSSLMGVWEATPADSTFFCLSLGSALAVEQYMATGTVDTEALFRVSFNSSAMGENPVSPFADATSTQFFVFGIDRTTSILAGGMVIRGDNNTIVDAYALEGQVAVDEVDGTVHMEADDMTSSTTIQAWHQGEGKPLSALWSNLKGEETDTPVPFAQSYRQRFIFSKTDTPVEDVMVDIVEWSLQKMGDS